MITEAGDGDDSDNKGGEMQLYQLVANDFIEDCERDKIEHAINLDEIRAIPGAPDGWKLPGLPPHFKQYKAKCGAPILEEINNPRGLSQCTKNAGSQNDHTFVDHFTSGSTTVMPKIHMARGRLEIGNLLIVVTGYNAGKVDK